MGSKFPKHIKKVEKRSIINVRVVFKDIGLLVIIDIFIVVGLNNVRKEYSIFPFL